MFSGDFEVHLTGSAWQVDELATLAEQRGAKFCHIQLRGGVTPSQPMLTIPGSGTLAEVEAMAARWCADVEAAGLLMIRVKIEAAPWNEGVPRLDTDAREDLYFEHHVKVLLPAGDLAVHRSLDEAVRDHAARVSRNARRERPDSREERFVTQRCHGVGRETARTRLDDLLTALRAGGFEVLEVEEEYVVHDDALYVDRGWFDDGRQATVDSWRTKMRTAPAGMDGYPSTYKPLVVKNKQDIHQRATFDPALKHFSNAYRPGEPVFGNDTEARRWLTQRREAMAHVLAVVAGSPWAEHLVLRGSIVLRAWLGDAAREPGDLDFVVTPRTFDADSGKAIAMLEDLVAAVASDPGPGLRADQVATEHIWTYDRVPGRRLVFPFDVEGLPQGTVQLDFVFAEPLPEAPITVEIPPLGTSMHAATPSLSLAWKLQWLMTDSYPQGKDLYDAVLLAEYTSVPLPLVRELLRPELGARADDFTAESVLSLPSDVDWPNFHDDYPTVEGDAESWLRRLAAALGH